MICNKCGDVLRVNKTEIKRFKGVRNWGKDKGKIWRRRYRLVNYSCHSDKCNERILGSRLYKSGFRVRGEPVCEHEFEEMCCTPMFDHKYICKKCGYWYCTDSSG